MKNKKMKYGVISIVAIMCIAVGIWFYMNQFEKIDDPSIDFGYSYSSDSNGYYKSGGLVSPENYNIQGGFIENDEIVAATDRECNTVCVVKTDEKIYYDNGADLVITDIATNEQETITTTYVDDSIKSGTDSIGQGYSKINETYYNAVDVENYISIIKFKSDSEYYEIEIDGLFGHVYEDSETGTIYYIHDYGEDKYADRDRVIIQEIKFNEQTSRYELGAKIAEVPYIDGYWTTSNGYYYDVRNEVLYMETYKDDADYLKPFQIIAYDLNTEKYEIVFEAKSTELDSMNKFGNLKFMTYENNKLTNIFYEQLGSNKAKVHIFEYDLETKQSTERVSEPFKYKNIFFAADKVDGEYYLALKVKSDVVNLYLIADDGELILKENSKNEILKDTEISDVNVQVN